MTNYLRTLALRQANLSREFDDGGRTTSHNWVCWFVLIKKKKMMTNTSLLSTVCGFFIFLPSVVSQFAAAFEGSKAEGKKIKWK